MRPRAAPLTLVVLSLLCCRAAIAAPLPASPSKHPRDTTIVRGAQEPVSPLRLLVALRAADTEESRGKEGKEKKGGSAEDGRSGEAGNGAKRGGESGRGKAEGAQASGEKSNGLGSKHGKSAAKNEGKAVSDGNGRSEKGEPSKASGGDNKNAAKGGKNEEKAADKEGEESEGSGVMTTSDMIAEARSHSDRLMKGGFIEFIEWLFVFILVAPGTFPAIGCVLLSCTSFWRRRLAGAPSSAESSSLASSASTRTIASIAATPYQRVSHGEHGALVRARAKVTSEERDSDVL